MNPEINPDKKFNYFDILYDESHLNAVLIMETDGTILNANPAFVHSFGYDEEELKQHNFSFLFTAEDQQSGKPVMEIEKVLRTGQADDKNFLVHKNKGPVWVSGESILAINKAGEKRVLKVVQDISDQKAAEYATNRANEFNETILTSIDDIVVVLDDELKLLKSNPAFSDLFNVESSASDVDNFLDFIQPFDTTGQFSNTIKDFLHKKQSFTNLSIPITVSGKLSTYSVSGRSISTGESDAGFLLTMHDITFQKMIEREREDVIGFVTHELRNPLSNLMLCNELLRDELTSGGQKEYAENLLQRSQDNIKRLNRMITELYEATKIQSGNFILEMKEFDFDEMIEDAIDTVKVLQPDFNFKTSGKGGKVNGDRYRLTQVVTNYMNNAIKYSDGHKDIRISMEKDDELLTLSVSDDGLGISDDQLPFIFERFFRAEKTKNLEGIGLGLFFCSRIIAAHGGKVWAESNEGDGSTFYFSIPAN